MLTPCGGCGRQVSDRAPVCPFCRKHLRLPRGFPEEPAAAAAPAAPAASAAAPGTVSPLSLPSLAPPVTASPVPVALPSAAVAPAPPPPPTSTVGQAPAFASGPVKPGQTIGDDYVVARVLGEGGFGLVYLVTSRSSGRIYALKAMRDELVRDEAARELFRREARIWIDLDRHPYLVRAYLVDEIHGRLYLAMEFVAPGERGLNGLDGYLRKHPPDLPQALRWAVEFCHGMEYAVSRGVRCHRDIKPANILIGADGHVRISDFGIAGVAQALPAPGPVRATAGLQQTQAGTVFGTPTHMSPEQFVDAASCDERSDVYSFGVVLFQMASRGGLPFVPAPAQGALESWMAFRELHTRAPVPRLDSKLFPIVERCLQKDPARRYPGFAELRAALTELLRAETGEVPAPPSVAGLEAWEWSNKGLSLASLGRDEEALACYERALALDARLAPVHNNRGNALTRLGRREEAIAAFERALALDPAYASPWTNKAIALGHLGRSAEALRCVEEALRLDSRDTEGWITRGVLLGRLGHRQEELESLDRALLLDPRHALAHFNRGTALQQLGRLPEALLALEASLASDPRHVAAWIARGVALGDSGRPAEMLVALDQAIALAPGDAQAWYNRGNALLALGRLPEAHASFGEAARLAPEVALIWNNKGLAELQLGRRQEGIASLQRFLQLAAPQDPLRPGVERALQRLAAGQAVQIGGQGQTRFGDDLAEAAEPEGEVVGGGFELPAEPAPEAAAEPAPDPPAPPNEVALLNDEGTAFFGQGRFAEALDRFERALAVDAYAGTTWNNRANTLFKLGQGDAAIAAHERGIASDPLFLECWINKAAIEGALGRRAESLRSALEFVSLEPASRAAEGQRLVQSGRAAGVQPAPRNALGLLAQAMSQGVKGRFEEARQAAEQAARLDPRLPTAPYAQALALVMLGRPAEALPVLDAALALDPCDGRFWHEKAQALGRLRRWEEAVAAHEKAAELRPRDPAVWSDRGRALSVVRRHAEAVESLARACALAPGNAAPWFNRALAEEELKRRPEAARSFERFLECATPQMAAQVEMARSRLQILRAELGRPLGPRPVSPAAAAAPPPPAPARPAAAPAGPPELPPVSLLKVAPLAATLAPAVEVPAGLSVDELVRRGTINLQQGQPLRALPHFDRALQIDPGSAPAWLGKGDTFLTLRRFPDAVSSYTKALEIVPGDISAWARKGAALEGALRFEEAVDAYDEAVELNPRDASLWTGRGSAQLGMGRAEAALRSFDKALSLEQRHPLARYGKALAEDRLQRPEAARSYQQFLAAAPPHLSAQIQAARGRLQQLRSS